MRALAAWTFYLAGDVVSRIMNKVELRGRLYDIYNWLMVTSTKIQGQGNGPWEIINRPKENIED